MMSKKQMLIIIVIILTIVLFIMFLSSVKSKNSEITLDVGKGVIDIYPEGYSQTYTSFEDGEEVKNYLTPGDASIAYYDDNYPTDWEDFEGTYIITGDSGYTNTDNGQDSFLDIMNFSGKPVEYNLIFDNLKVRAADWCTAVRFRGNAPVTVNIKNIGNTVIEGHNHPAFKINANDMNSNNVYVTIHNTLGSSLSFADNYNTYSNQIYGSDQIETGIIIFKINEQIVDNGINGGSISNSGATFENTHDFHNFVDNSNGQQQISALWTPPFDELSKDDFVDNNKSVTCTFKCVECNESFEICPSEIFISNDAKTGTYKAILPAYIAKTESNTPVESSITYNLFDNSKTYVSLNSVDSNGIVWLKETAGNSTQWFGLKLGTIISEDFDLNNKYFYVEWISPEKMLEHPEYENLDNSIKSKIQDSRGKLFYASIADKYGNKQDITFSADNPALLYVKTDDNWDKEDLQSVFITTANDELIEVSYDKNITDPDNNTGYAVMSLTHFSPYFVFDENTAHTGSNDFSNSNNIVVPDGIPDEDNTTNTDSKNPSNSESDSIISDLFITGDTQSQIIALSATGLILLALGALMFFKNYKKHSK